MRGRGEEVCSCGAALRGLGRVCDGVGKQPCWREHPLTAEPARCAESHQPMIVLDSGAAAAVSPSQRGCHALSTGLSWQPGRPVTAP